MENIIKELIQIESEADIMVTEIRDEMKHLDDRMRDKENEIRGNIDKQTTERITKLYDEAHRESAVRIAGLKKKSEQAIAALTALYKQNRSQWEADIAKKIIGQ